MRTLLYARVSNKASQGDNFSIMTQLEAMQNYCTQQGWRVVSELHEQESAFQEGLSRSKLNIALEMARKHQIDAIMFFSPDRFTRDMADGVILRRELYQLGVKLICYHPVPREITNDLEVLNVLTDWQSQAYVERMKEAAMRGRRGKAKSGLFPHGKVHFGYTIEGKGRAVQVVINEPYGTIVRQIFTWCARDGLSAIQIAARLIEAGISTPADVCGRKVPRLRKSGEWSERHVRDILKNEAYTGIYYALRWKRNSKKKAERLDLSEAIPITIPPLVDRAVWEAVQVQMAKRTYHGETLHKYLMSTRLKCACGSQKLISI